MIPFLLYLEPGFEITLFQCSLELVKSDVGVESGPSNLSLSPSTVTCTLFIFLMRTNDVDNTVICDLRVFGDFVPVGLKKSVSYLYLPESLEK